MLKKNSSYNEEFNYNMSGLEVVYDGKILVEESLNSYAETNGGTSDQNGNSVSLIKSYVYKFKPNFKIFDQISSNFYFPKSYRWSYNGHCSNFFIFCVKFFKILEVLVR